MTINVSESDFKREKIPNQSNDPNIGAMLDHLYARTDQLACQVELGQIGFIDAVDMAYSAAQWAGLTNLAGEDAVQNVLADAFCGLSR